MFSPMGATSLTQIYRKLVSRDVEAARAALEAHLWERGEPPAEDRLAKFFACSPVDLIEQRMIDELPSTMLAQPAGQATVQLDLEHLREALTYWRLNCSELYRSGGEPKTTDDELCDLIQRFRLWDGEPSEFAEMYDFCLESDPDLSPWAVHIEHGYAFEHQTLPFFYEREKFTIDLSAFELRRKIPDADSGKLTRLARTLRQYAGASLCVQTDAIKNNTFFSAGLAPEYTVKQAQVLDRNAGGSGRPRTKREAVKAAYLAVFPNSHGKLTRKQVLHCLISQHDINCSLQTLDRAIAEARRASTAQPDG